MGPVELPDTEARDAAIERADAGANHQWMAVALWVVRELARHKSHFSTDEVWDALGDVDVRTPERRAMGAVMIRAAAAGVIEPTDTWVRSYRRECHARPVMRWRSLLHGRSSVPANLSFRTDV